MYSFDLNASLKVNFVNDDWAVTEDVINGVYSSAFSRKEKHFPYSKYGHYYTIKNIEELKEILNKAFNIFGNIKIFTVSNQTDYSLQLYRNENNYSLYECYMKVVSEKRGRGFDYEAQRELTKDLKFEGDFNQLLLKLLSYCIN